MCDLSVSGVVSLLIIHSAITVALKQKHSDPLDCFLHPGFKILGTIRTRQVPGRIQCIDEAFGKFAVVARFKVGFKVFRPGRPDDAAIRAGAVQKRMMIYPPQRSRIHMNAAALRWIYHHSLLDGTGPDGCIIGATRSKHLESNLEACNDGKLPESLVDALNTAWDLARPDCPQYFKPWMQKTI